MECHDKLTQRIVSDEVLDTAYKWLFNVRKEHSHNSDLWDLRRNWQHEKTFIRQTVTEGTYTFSPQERYYLPYEVIELWSSRDSLVLKAVSIVLGNHLRPIISPSCHHLKLYGGVKNAIRLVLKNLRPGQHVMKSDVKEYYDSIDHDILENMLGQYVTEKSVHHLVHGYLKRVVCSGGNYRDVAKGLSLRSPLSPLMGALYLKPMDDAMEISGLPYARFMDDWIIIAESRWKLRKAVSITNKVLDKLKLQQHPDKTFIGRVEKGFDFLGFTMRPGELYYSGETIKRFAERTTRLYEQGASQRRIGQYVRQWESWYRSVVEHCYPPGEGHVLCKNGRFYLCRESRDHRPSLCWSTPTPRHVVSPVKVSVTHTLYPPPPPPTANWYLPAVLLLGPAPRSIINNIAPNAPIIKSFTETIFITTPPECDLLNVFYQTNKDTAQMICKRKYQGLKMPLAA